MCSKITENRMVKMTEIMKGVLYLTDAKKGTTTFAEVPVIGEWLFLTGSR